MHHRLVLHVVNALVERVLHEVCLLAGQTLPAAPLDFDVTIVYNIDID